ncbi:MAG: hypothetical protein A3E81_01795 [Gammaproteobacteria bacterium RIFCSPHIGHO2_12_FULL_36_30]|nr:MAG: hypothetical protein A3E81_01795 [Gammaproteobacteria bacterium RIFCSPHIGHO2_12_FULL_36_30]
MSFKKNIFANYCGHFYTLFVCITIVPLYLQYLGAAAFGLISIYVMLQSWLSLLNIGLTPAMSREVTCLRDRKNGFFKIKKLLRSLEIIFLFINLLIMLGVALCSYWITHHWLKVQNLSYIEVIHCVMLMGVMVSFRFFADLYRAGIMGLEQQVWLNGVGIILTTLRYCGAYILLRWVTRTPVHFFEYQLLIAVIEPILLGLKCYNIIPTSVNYLLGFTISWDLIRKIFPFACSLFYTAFLWILLSQSDKLILSHVLSLTNYGYFGLVTIISGGILQFSMPINLALLPRMTRLLSQGKKEEMLQLYRNVTQIVVVIMLPLIGIIAIFSTHVIYIWTGNKIAANWAGPILFWYSLGNGFFAISFFPFYLQYVHGKLKLQVIIDTLFTLISFPLIVFFAYHYGAKGTAIIWFITRSILFLIWAPIVHYKYAPGLHWKWLMKDIFPIAATTLVVLCFIKKIHVDFELISRDEGFIILCGFTFIVLMASAAASSTCRHFFSKFIRERRNSVA